MTKLETDNLPLGHYPMSYRSRILKKEIDKYIEEGYQIIWQDECTAQVYKSRKLSKPFVPLYDSGFWIFAALVQLIINLFVRKDSLILTEVNEYGKVTKTKMGK